MTSMNLVIPGLMYGFIELKTLSSKWESWRIKTILAA